MLSIRTWHTYLGLLIAPSVIFLALTGSLQLFGLHEAHRGYEPFPLIEKLGKVHKDQVFALGEHHDAPAPEEEKSSAGKPPAKEDEPATGTVMLKGYFLFVALGLTTSTLLGLWMGLTHIRHKRIGWWLLATGVVVPVAVLLI